MGFGFGSRCGLLWFGLQGCEAEDFTVLVALVQGFKLVNEGGGTVSFESLVPEKKRKKKHINRLVNVNQQLASIFGLKKEILTLSYRWLFPHQ